MLNNTPVLFRRVYYLANHNFTIYLDRLPEEGRQTFLKNFETRLIGNDPTSPMRENSPLGFIYEFLFHMSEIGRSYTTLKQTEKLHRSNVRLPKGISKHDYRMILQEAHLEELYLFVNRVNNLFTFLLRAYKKEKDYFKLPSIISNVKSVFNDAFSTVINLRGTHIHQTRWAHGPESSRRILFLEDLVTLSPTKENKQKLRDAYREYHFDARANLRSTVAGAKDCLLGLPDILCLFFYTDGSMHIPAKYKT